MKVKIPLRTLTIIHQDQALLTEMSKLEEFIKTELNIKAIQYSTKEDQYVVLSAKPNLPVLGKKLGKEMGAFKALIEKLPSADVVKIENGGKVTLNGVDFDATEVLVQRNTKPGTQAFTNKFVTIELDCTLDQELVDEGLAREFRRLKISRGFSRSSRAIFQGKR